MSLSGRAVVSSPRTPWQNGYAERWVGTPRRQLLDQLIVLGERHLLHMVRGYVAYYNLDRAHMPLRGDAPIARGAARVVALPRVRGLHHRYAMVA